MTESSEHGEFGHPYEIWDVFTDTPLEGNPLAVFPLGEEIPSRLHGRLARELNLSETVFILPDDPAEADAFIRIHTPALELPFAGHPTLGAAYAIARTTTLSTVRLRTGAGIVTVTLTREADGEITGAEMAQPIPTVERYPEPDALLAALGMPAATLPIEIYTNGPRHVVVHAESAGQLTRLGPDMTALARLGEHGVAVVAPSGNGVVNATASPAVGTGPRSLASGDRSPPELAYATRNFCPGLGVPEDPATGSAAGPVAVHLLRHGHVASGQTVRLSQGAEIGRPSTLWATAQGTPEAIERVSVAGRAVRVAVGHYRAG